MNAMSSKNNPLASHSYKVTGKSKCERATQNACFFLAPSL